MRSACDAPGCAPKLRRASLSQNALQGAAMHINLRASPTHCAPQLVTPMDISQRTAVPDMGFPAAWLGARPRHQRRQNVVGIAGLGR